MSSAKDGRGVAAPVGSDSLVFCRTKTSGMGFYPDIGLRVFIQGRLKHQFKRRGVCAAILDGHVAEGLVNDEDGFRFGWGT